jgi:hypothetical protein
LPLSLVPLFSFFFFSFIVFLMPPVLFSGGIGW